MKKTRFLLICLLLVVIFTSFCGVAFADSVSETNGYYTFVMSRVYMPINVIEYSDVGSVPDGVPTIGSIAFTIADMPGRESVTLSTLYYDRRSQSADHNVIETAPYSQSHVFALDNTNFITINTYSGDAREGFPLMFFGTSNFSANVVSIEYFNSFDSSIDLDKIFVTPGVSGIRSTLDSIYVRWAGFKLTSLNGGFCLVVTQVCDADYNTTQGMNLMRASMSYRKYYLNQQTNDDWYNEGYNQGLVQGIAQGKEFINQESYQNGYDQGVRDQIESEAPKLYTLRGWLEFAFSALDVKIFGLFSIGDMLAFVFGVTIFFFVLRALKG